jgi:DNA-binding response OmpR family regulator
VRILLLDDDQSLVAMARDWLASAGHEVVALSDFHAAKNYLALNHPDAIITDVRLGAYNGLQILVIAKLERPSVVAIAMTGFDDPTIQSEVSRIGGHYLVKPVTDQDLLTLLNASSAPADETT